jgi:hypothetical protein
VCQHPPHSNDYNRNQLAKSRKPEQNGRMNDTVAGRNSAFPLFTLICAMVL